MPDILNLKKDENGNTVVVETSTLTNEVPLSAETLRTQIKQQAEILASLQAKLDAVLKFEAGKAAEASPTLTDSKTPVVDQAVLADIVAPLQAA